MNEYRLEQTTGAPLVFTGELLHTCQSSNAIDKLPNRLWFVANIYRTQARLYIAHVGYAAGPRLGREQPVLTTYRGHSAPALLDELDMVDPIETFVTGWPHEGRAEGKTRQHQSVCGYAAGQWNDLKREVAAALLALQPAEVVE